MSLIHITHPKGEQHIAGVTISSSTVLPRFMWITDSKTVAHLLKPAWNKFQWFIGGALICSWRNILFLSSQAYRAYEWVLVFMAVPPSHLWWPPAGWSSASLCWNRALTTRNNLDVLIMTAGVEPKWKVNDEKCLSDCICVAFCF